MGKRKKKKNKKSNLVDLGGGVYMNKDTNLVISNKNIYVGNKNKTDFPNFVALLKKTQIEMKVFLNTFLQYFYRKEDIICGDGYIYVRGNDPICLTSHMDTTPTVGGAKRTPVIDYYENIETDENGNVTHTLTSPQGIGGDDRCGIWSIIMILKETAYRPYIVFCEDEEIGCVGSGKFAKTEYVNELTNCKFLVEIDRRGNNDCVFYDDDNKEFHKWVKDVTGYTEAIGSCSDICNLSSACGVSSVNLSSGYYHEHTLEEKIIVEETIHTKDVVIKLIEEGCKEEVEQFEYVDKYNYSYNYNWYSNYYNHLYNDDGDDYSWYDYKGYKKDLEKSDADKYNETTISTDCELGFNGYFVYMGQYGYEQEDCVEADSKLGCIAKFMMSHSELSWNDVLDYYFESLT